MAEVRTLAYAGRDGAPARVAYRRAGVPGAPPVVLIHGVGMGSEVWAPQIAALAAGHDVIALDMPGHGGSSLPPEEARLSDYAGQVIALLDALAIPSAVLVGHSMGALVALETALSHPARVRAVAALNAVFCRTPEQRAIVTARAGALDAEGRAASHAAAVQRWFGDPVPPELEASAAQVAALLAAGDPVGYARTYALFAASDAAHRDRLSSLARPALFMTADGDGNSTPAMSQAMAALAPQGRAEVLEGARHMMTLTHPDAVNAHLLAFLDALAPAPAFDPKAFRQALGAFLTGVTVVTTRNPAGEMRGFTANSFSSVSLDPPLILVCLAKTASSFPVFSAAENFAVSVLAAGQKDVSALFASKSPDKFAGAPWHLGPAGSPVIAGAAAWFDCTRHEVVEAGDHVILIGHVRGFGAGTEAPLGYCRGAYVDVSLGQQALAKRDEPARVGALLESDGALLLVEDGKGGLDLPTGSCLEPASNPRSLRGALAQLGVEGQLGFLFAVFETPGDGSAPPTVSIYYRGGFNGTPRPEAGAVLVPLEAVDLARLPDEATRSMLARYLRERREDAFGIYVGDAERGQIHPLAAAPLG
ncbi:alpha/beta fold hydrolase [Ancylobacter vacuolatus]|uniref:Flavin reductase (DIM6/NTAB) family NADH-FMN oxidoreductase RutF/pimeloyl-ACP methyl ester carboxylesterase n=1 Tax=Ancylobacter vacuolatus TaxID=223389 RepID=A0ABU0DC94_9HYPH|nr:alpha/beta fold hydrolase [Ancylobacter vacuolatus]MDQ0346038.1 flavin reductase (DIM6/NTAB) family NADH-FMN oxidoreductase RutF/pimeloyl-ACP methyl ester carboxylesterase [Ancylobacter vacuolatus]